MAPIRRRGSIKSSAGSPNSHARTQQRGVHTSTSQLEADIHAFIARYNKIPSPIDGPGLAAASGFSPCPHRSYAARIANFTIRGRIRQPLVRTEAGFPPAFGQHLGDGFLGPQHLGQCSSLALSTFRASNPGRMAAQCLLSLILYDQQRRARCCKLGDITLTFISGSDATTSMMMTIAGLDKEILLTLNAFGGGNQNLWALAYNSLFRGFPLFFSISALWFSSDQPERRSRILAGLLAACLATVVSVWSQFHIDVHTRPILDSALHLETVVTRTPWDRTSSFPSDLATLFFALAAVVFVEQRLVGLFCFIWVAVMIAIPRVIVGLHYPSDIVGSFVLGSVSVFIFAKSPYPRKLFERALIRSEGHMYVVHALFVVFLAEASALFDSLQNLGKELVRLL